MRGVGMAGATGVRVERDVYGGWMNALINNEKTTRNNRGVLLNFMRVPTFRDSSTVIVR